MNSFVQLGGRFIGTFGRGRGLSLPTTQVFSGFNDNPFSRCYSNENTSGRGRGRGTPNPFPDKDNKGIGGSKFDEIRKITETKASPQPIDKNVLPADRLKDGSRIVDLELQPNQTQTTPVGRGRGTPLPPAQTATQQAPQQLSKVAPEDLFHVPPEEEEGAEPKESENENEYDPDEDDPFNLLAEEIRDLPIASLTETEKTVLKWRQLSETDDMAVNDMLEDEEEEEPTEILGDAELAKFGDSDSEVLIEQSLALANRYYKALLSDTGKKFRKIREKKDRTTKALNTIRFNQRERKRQHKLKRQQHGKPEPARLPLPVTGEEHAGADLSYLIRDVPPNHPVHAFAKMVAQNPSIPIKKKRMMVSTYVKELENAQRKFAKLCPSGESVYTVTRITKEEIETN